MPPFFSSFCPSRPRRLGWFLSFLFCAKEGAASEGRRRWCAASESFVCSPFFCFSSAAAAGCAARSGWRRGAARRGEGVRDKTDGAGPSVVRRVAATFVQPRRRRGPPSDFVSSRLVCACTCGVRRGARRWRRGRASAGSRHRPGGGRQFLGPARAPAARGRASTRGRRC